MATREELLEHLWQHVINVNLDQATLHAEIDHSKHNPADPFADTGAALERLLAAGASPSDICLVRRASAYEATFATLYAIGDPAVDNNDVFMLFEDLLTSDPSGMEGRPGSATGAA
jgi:hypothetical protein